MKKIFASRCIILLIILTQGAFTYEYKVPPTSTIHGHVPYISDEAMEQCIILYNEAEQLQTELSRTQVDKYSQNSVDSYNNKVRQHSHMINEFNKNCAGKQSESAYKAAQKLNGEKTIK